MAPRRARQVNSKSSLTRPSPETLQDTIGEAPSGDESDQSDEDDVPCRKSKAFGDKVQGADEVLQREFDEEHEQLQAAADKKFTGGKDLSALVQKLMYFNSFSKTHYENILPFLIDGSNFVIDGDSLFMMGLLTQGLSDTTLHLVYAVEKFLQAFSSKGLNFNIVFFEVYEKCWNNFPYFNVARSSLKLHLMKNQSSISVLCMESVWSDDFRNFVQCCRPSFIMMTTSPTYTLQDQVETESQRAAMEWLSFVVYAQVIFSDLFYLDTVDILTVQSTAQNLMATVHSQTTMLKKIHDHIIQMMKSVENLLPRKKTPKPYCTLQEDVRSASFIFAAASIINSVNSDAKKEKVKVMKVVLLSGVLLKLTPLRKRCFKKCLAPPETYDGIISDFLRQMAIVLDSLSKDEASTKSANFLYVADMWHGQYLRALNDSINDTGNLTKDDLGDCIAEKYEQIISEVNQLLKDYVIEPYPLFALGEKVVEPVEDHEKACRPPIVPYKLFEVNFKLGAEFTADIISDVVCSESKARILQGVSASESIGLAHRQITDEYDRVPDGSNVEAEKKKMLLNPRRSQNQRNSLARYMTLYGQSLEGRDACKVVVVETTKKKVNEKMNQFQKKTQPKAVSKKDKIIFENMERKAREHEKHLKERFQKLQENVLRLKAKESYNEALSLCDLELLRAFDLSDFVVQILFIKGEVYYTMWKEKCCAIASTCKDLNESVNCIDMTAAKQLFLVIKRILKMKGELKTPLETKKQSILGCWLCTLGFCELASLWNLPRPSNDSGNNYSVGINHIQFQLVHLGADLDRDTGGKPDQRADGFLPDPWQAKLFDIIDRNQSALVVAPTSSGKTYASYYCMERVIRESNDGVVVYVSPTKALVNQVQATIYARFKKVLPPGKVLQGIFTRDYRNNVMNCQILTTVPECLEILLFSPKCHAWVKKLKYVIFDEVHCLAGQSGGVSWENCILLIPCPFLALSATIHKPETFCAWLQNAEELKKAQALKYGLNERSSDSYQVSLVVHTERHNHLKNNIVMPDGSLKHVHPYSFIDTRTIQQSEGIPPHISLSPDEALELYFAMKKVVLSDKIDDLCPEKYFGELCPSGFLSMQAVKKFSELLRTILERETYENIAVILKSLRKVDFDDLEVGDAYVLQNIPQLITTLKDQGMLPALLFSYDRGMVQALPRRLLHSLQDEDDFVENEVTDLPSDSEEESGGKKSAKTLHRRFSGKTFKKKLGLMNGPSMLNSNGSLRGAASDEKVVEYVEQRLMRMGYSSNDIFVNLLRRGLGHHFSGMNNKERSAVEILFRLKMLNLVAATGTLALGIHMPCKTVVVTSDSPYLNPLQFQQMSGRAGRRGFDKEGNVILYGLHKRKMQTLITGTMPKMLGNFPLSVSLILRLACLVDSNSHQGNAEALARASTLLEKSLLYESSPELKKKMKYFFISATQFLIHQKLIDSNGQPQQMAQMVVNIHYHEPGSYAFVFLLRCGILDQMIKCDRNGVTEESLSDLMILLNFLFARHPIAPHLLQRKRANSLVALPPLPKTVLKGLKKYNKVVLEVFSNYFESITADACNIDGVERLPLFGLNVEPGCVLNEEARRGSKLLTTLDKRSVTNNICSAFAGLSGNTDQDLYHMSGYVRHVRDNITEKVVPTLELDMKCNAYALDFFKHGIKQAIQSDNGLKSGDAFMQLKDFMLTMHSIHKSLQEVLDSESRVLKAFGVISEKFGRNFQLAFLNHLDV